MHRVGVVPEQPEIRCGGVHLDQPAHHFPGVHRTGRVGVHRNTPHALDRRVGGDQFLDEVDVGAVVMHRHGDHLDAEALGDREMPVVARRGTEELDDRLSNPGPRRVHPAVQHREHHGVVHQFQAGVVAGDQVGHRDAEQFTEDRAQAGQTVLATVVAGVGALVVAEVAAAGQAPAGRWTGRVARWTACRG